MKAGYETGMCHQQRDTKSGRRLESVAEGEHLQGYTNTWLQLLTPTFYNVKSTDLL